MTDFDQIRASLETERDTHRAKAAEHAKHADKIDATLRALAGAAQTVPGGSKSKAAVKSNAVSKPGASVIGAIAGNGKDTSAHHLGMAAL